jgi:hypothetical protein
MGSPTMKKTRFFYLHAETNVGKIAALEALQLAYTTYLAACAQTMLSAHRCSLPLAEKKLFFPGCDLFSSQIVKNVQDHAIQIVSAWAASKYTNTLKPKLTRIFREKGLDAPLYAMLCIIGKNSIDAPTPKITQEALDFYWWLLLDPEACGKPPTISNRCGMRLSEMTAVFGTSEETLRSGAGATKLSRWWLGFSHLGIGKARIQLPLCGNPYISSADEVSSGILARKDKRGRWRFEVVEKKEWLVPFGGPQGPPKPAPEAKKVGLDVGFNVMVATNDGRLFGQDLKPKFNARYERIKERRANRQRQGLRENSPRLDALEAKLSGLVASMVGEVVNLLLLAYAGYVFVIEDLDLSGCKGQKRFAYRALHKNLERKAPTEVVNPAYTSQECPSCHYVSRKNRSGIKFICRSCGRIAHADVVGGINLLGRSEDKQIVTQNDPAQVKRILRERALHRRSARAKHSSSGERKKAPAPSGPRLTVLASQERCIASN